MAHEKERELLEKFRNAINSHLYDLRMDGYIRDKMEIPESAIDSFLSTLPEEEEEKTCLTCKHQFKSISKEPCNVCSEFDMFNPSK